MTKHQHRLTDNDLPIERQANRTRHVWVGSGNSTQSIQSALLANKDALLDPIHLCVRGTCDELKQALACLKVYNVFALAWHSVHPNPDVGNVARLILDACPELVYFSVTLEENNSQLDFISTMLELGSKIKSLHLSLWETGGVSRFFGALANSQVVELNVKINVGEDDEHEFVGGLSTYLRGDRLTSFKVNADSRVFPSHLGDALTGCLRMTQLNLTHCLVYHPIVFPKNLSRLVAFSCDFRGLEWDLPSIRVLYFYAVSLANPTSLGRALASKAMDMLSFYGCDFVGPVLEQMDLGYVRHLRLQLRVTMPVSADQIARAAVGGGVKHLEILGTAATEGTILHRLGPALRSPGCTLDDVSLGGREFWGVERRFYQQRRLFALLLARRKPFGKLQRLPVEMFRMVAGMLMF